MVADKRRDLKRDEETSRHAAAAMALQIWGAMDPDQARYVAQRLVRVVLRAGVRPTDGNPTADEVDRAIASLNRRGHPELLRDDVYAALFCALCEEGIP